MRLFPSAFRCAAIIAGAVSLFSVAASRGSAVIGPVPRPTARPPAVCRAVAVPWPSIASLNPALNEGDDEAVSGDLYLPLIDAVPDGTIDWTGSLASRVDVDRGNTRFTVTLRSVSWSDGSPVTSADLLYDWSLIQAQGETWILYGFGGIPNLVRSITAPDPRTVVVTTTRAINPNIFERVGLAVLAPLPSRQWRRFTLREQQTLQSTGWFFAVTDGPYRLLSMDLSRSAVLGRNPYFSGARPAIGRVLLDFAADENPLEALRGGTVDVAPLSGDLVPLLPRLHGFHAVSVPDSYDRLLAANFADPAVAFFRDVRVRVALADAIDQRRIVATAFGGYALPQRGFVLSSTPALEPPDLRAAVNRADPDRGAARRLLDAAGWRPGPDGVRRRDGRRLAFTLLVDTDRPSDIAEAQLIEDDLRQVGAAISIRQVAIKQMIALFVGRRPGWGAMLIGFGYGAWPDAATMFASGPDGHLGFDDKHMDQLLAAYGRSADPDALFAIERYAFQTQPAIFLPQQESLFVARDGIDGVAPTFSNGFAPEHLSLGSICQD